MFKKDSVKFNGFTVQSPATELSAGEKDLNDPVTLTWNNPHESEYIIRISRFDVTKTSLKNPSQRREGSHGSYFGASSDNIRVVEIRGEMVSNTKTGEQSGWQILNRIFRPDEFPSVLNRGLFRLDFQDYSGQDWFLYGQVDQNYSRMQFKDFDDGIVPFSVFMKCEDARIFSDDQLIETVTEGDVGGMAIGGGAFGGISQYPLHAVSNGFDLPNNYSVSSPAEITITKNDGVTSYDSAYLAVNPKFMNTTNGAWIKINHNMELDDVIVIDTLSGDLTLNGTVNNSLIETGSDFPYIASGNNNYALIDDTHTSLFGENIKAVVKYRKIMK